MQQLNWLFENWIFVFGTALLLAAIFAPDRRMPKIPPEWPERSKHRVINFYKQNQRFNIEYWPMSRLGLAALLSAFAGITASEFENLIFYIWGLIGIGIIFGIADIFNQFIKGNRPRGDWKPFSGFLIPAIPLILGGFAWIREDPTMYWIGIAGAALAALDLALKLKKTTGKNN